MRNIQTPNTGGNALLLDEGDCIYIYHNWSKENMTEDVTSKKRIRGDN